MKHLYTVKVTNRNYGAGDWPGFLDMLRYDRPTVRTWDHDSNGVFSVELEFDRLPTLDRWHSFGLYPVERRFGHE